MGVLINCDRCKRPIDLVRQDHTVVSFTGPNKHTVSHDFCPACMSEIRTFIVGPPSLTPPVTVPQPKPKPKAKRRGK